MFQTEEPACVTPRGKRKHRVSNQQYYQAPTVNSACNPSRDGSAESAQRSSTRGHQIYVPAQEMPHPVTLLCHLPSAICLRTWSSGYSPPTPGSSFLPPGRNLQAHHQEGHCRLGFSPLSRASKRIAVTQWQKLWVFVSVYLFGSSCNSALSHPGPGAGLILEVDLKKKKKKDDTKPGLHSFQWLFDQAKSLTKINSAK